MFKKIKQQFKRFITGKSGFSLVELIVVIAIMAVMAAVLAPALLGYVEHSRAQKDTSAMGEVTNAIQLSLADSPVYDEVLQASVKENYSCYADGDTNTNIDVNKNILKEPDYWLYNDNCRLLDETVYAPSGKMRGVTVTFKPNGEAKYILKDGIINQMGNNSTQKGNLAGKTLEDIGFENLYNRLRSIIGDTISVSSQTYRNSDYTVFISLGTTGGNQADMQDAIKVWGQHNGTNLPEVASASSIVGGIQDKGEVVPETPEEPEEVIDINVTGGAEFYDGVVLSWTDLQKPENGEKYGYDASLISDTSVEDYAFAREGERRGQLKKIIIPDSVTYIGRSAFSGRKGLSSVKLPAGLTEIQDYVFSNCQILGEINMPNTVTKIGKYSFNACQMLQEINIPDSVTSIGERAFGSCFGVKSITWTSQITTIPSNIFSDLMSLQTIQLPNTVTRLEDYAFRGCTSKLSFTIPKSITYIGRYAFGDNLNEPPYIRYDGTCEEFFNNVEIDRPIGVSVVRCSDEKAEI